MSRRGRSSRRVPSAEPRLDHPRLDLGSRKATNAVAVSTNCVASRLGRRSHQLEQRLEIDVRLATRIRSDQERTCGERYAPVDTPRERRSSSTIRVVVDLPFVPQWTAGSPTWGWPSSMSSSRIRSSPKPSSGHGDSASSQATLVM